MHSHGPAPPQQQQQQQQMPAPDPAILAAIDATFKEVPFKLGPPNDSQIFCPVHSLEKCTDCNIDFTSVNQLAKLIATIPAEVGVPPPAQLAGPQRAQLVTKMKEEGNVRILI
jgi:translocation protein SEC72